MWHSTAIETGAFDPSALGWKPSGLDSRFYLLGLYNQSIKTAGSGYDVSQIGFHTQIDVQMNLVWVRRMVLLNV